MVVPIVIPFPIGHGRPYSPPPWFEECPEGELFRAHWWDKKRHRNHQIRSLHTGQVRCPDCGKQWPVCVA